MKRQPDHYDTLGVSADASDAEIKRRYRRLMREAHPDANAGDPGATRRAARINTAYETLGDPVKRREYDVRRVPPSGTRRSNGIYAHWAEQDDWEDIVAANVPAKRPAHAHDLPPLIEPEQIEVDTAELRANPRVRRSIVITNRCACVLRGDVSTSEPWVWGPIGRFEIAPGSRQSFAIEIIARKVSFPGLSRVSFVANDWTGVVPVKITGYNPKIRRSPQATEIPYVRHRRVRAARR